MDLDPKTSDARSVYRLLQACVVPRPIAWVTSLCGDGATNLAPFSFFMAHCSDPPIISISVGPREGREKDTRRNIEENGEFVVNVVTEEVLEAVLVSAQDYDRGVSEIEQAGLTRLPSLKVKPPRIAESPIQMECRLHQAVLFGNDEPGWAVLFGEILHFHVADELWDGDYVSPDFAPIGRFYGSMYCRTEDRISQKETWAAYLEKVNKPRSSK
jgi:flavin reductase (DIM6/NTAB) family NADH-FMN oxidoreductase RutF